MLKKIEIPTAIHLKKFIEAEYIQFIDAKGYIRVDRRTELGKLIHFVSDVDPFPKKYVPPKNVPLLKLSYYDESYSRYFPVSKIEEFNSLIDEMFRRAMICEVRGVHAKSKTTNYTELVRDFIERYGIEADIDIEFETLRKVYRDYQSKIFRKFQKNFSEISPDFSN